MQETLELILDYVRGAWRFRRQALITAWATALIGWLTIFALPDVYEAKARIYVDTKTALKPVLANLVADQDVNAQLNLVRQSLLENPQLEPLAREVGLIDARVLTPQQRIGILNSMRERIQLTVTLAATENRQEREPGSIYAISYQDV
ncbi:MAG TPA: hypothetical protein VHK24_05475, partial [Steroidobacter sp.]|nr:hypothetical protein [Steroidobacter sp.]